ncbi:helix-turn-helix domain-containing protein [Luteipulveratus sp. YIM 133132]|uniref:helix-turn-helix domain-containing protein n=1 Tax=Luteipulveratus flavus TaxID=3031728 RepID=UPI0023B0B94D|nr:helix-turn-helix domain-containing protein [Luteipulveratus sp. YIM 133132]MDE9365762.1 helix-turn-helix domain-containing protein [Luteipulveratus sp. YIM 133132]
MDEYVEYEIPTPLRPYVAAISGYHLSGYRSGTHVGLPSASLTCVFDFGDGLDLSGMNLAEPQRFSTTTAGLYAGPVTIHHDGHQHGVMLMLTPLGLRGLFGTPAAELAGTVVELTDLLGRDGARLADQVRSAPGWTGLDVLSDALLRRLPEHGPDDVAAQVWSRVRRGGGAATVTELVRESGWSERHLRNATRSAYGVGPKTLSRLLRFERSVERVRTGARLADVAAVCGYADQAHLARDWRELAGRSPSAWLRAEEFVPA